MLKNLKPKFIKSDSPLEKFEIWDRYLDEKYIFITEKIIFDARFRNFPNVFSNTIYAETLGNRSEEGKIFELTFDFFDAPNLSFSNSENDIIIKNKIKKFYERLKQNNFIINIECPESVGKIDHSFLTKSLIERSENINNSKYFTNILIRCIITKELSELRTETTNFIVKVILKEIRYKVTNIKETEVNFGLLEFIQRIDLIPLLKKYIKNLNLSIEEFDVNRIINNNIINKVKREFMDALSENEVSYFNFVMSSKPYIKYSVKFKVGDFYRDMDS